MSKLITTNDLIAEVDSIEQVSKNHVDIFYWTYKNVPEYKRCWNPLSINFGKLVLRERKIKIQKVIKNVPKHAIMTKVF